MDNVTSPNKGKSVELRKKGLSYNEICQKLGVPKSTLSGWLKNMPLSQKIKNENIAKAKLNSSVNIREFNKKRSLIYKAKTDAELNDYAKQITSLSRQELFFLGLGLFMAEGSRREKWMVRFVNSDPLIITLAMKFFREICEVNEESIRMRIHIHSNCDYQEALDYWSRLSKVPEKYFWKPQTLISKSSQAKRKPNQLKYGTLHVTIMNAQTIRRLKGWSLGLEKILTICRGSSVVRAHD